MPATTTGKTIELKDLLARRVRTLEIAIGDDTGETFWVKYTPEALTKQLQADLADVDGPDSAAMLLASFIRAWSLTVDGEPYPITQENLQALGLPLLMSISTLVWEDFNAHALGKVTSIASPQDSNGS
jgi:hypothetical protein